VIGRVIAVVVAVSFVSLTAVHADEVEMEEEIVIEKEMIMAPVSAAPPPRVELTSKAIAAGIGLRWGQGNLWFEGEEYAFSVKGLSVGDLGASRVSAIGDVQNLNDVSDFAGRYVALQAGVAAGVGVSTVTMRNEKGVVISLRGDLQGLQLTLGGEGLTISIQ
jgi:hypothetical protein